MSRRSILLCVSVFCLCLTLGTGTYARDGDSADPGNSRGRTGAGNAERPHPFAERIDRARQNGAAQRRFEDRNGRGEQPERLERAPGRPQDQAPERESFRRDPEAGDDRGGEPGFRGRARRLRDDWEGAASGRTERLSPEERRELRREIHDAGRDLYEPPPRRPKRDR